MAVRTVCVYPDAALRRDTEEITVFDDELKALAADMFDTMYASDGIGLAAPQIGISKKIAVIDYHGDKNVLVNPVITAEEGCVTREEGCLSFPGIYEKVESPEKITVEYSDENGEKHIRELDGFAACVFHHEIDHLNGHLLIDRVSPLKRAFLKKKMAKRAGDK
ncbi:MAG: peptide deformylase [Synergistes sp.]|nr:peptide deformylase [Synergistes sp.]MCR5336586.1 peptide deformylase [Synergistes sp.]